MEPVSSALAVAINTYNENNRQLSECLCRVRINLPDATVFVFVNGASKQHVSIACQFGFQAEEVTNYGNNEQWYLWWRRMLEWFVSTGRHALLKLDPDSMVDAPPSAIPEAPYFGCIDDWFIQGGVTGLSRALSEELLASGLLEQREASRRQVTRKAFADDKYLAATIAQLSVGPTSWNEVLSRWRVPVPNHPIRYSIVHPRYYP